MLRHSITALPEIASDETLYSWCATAHLMSDSANAGATGLKLLGFRHATRQHDLPVSLAKLPLIQGSSARDRIELLCRHTIAGFYWPFLGEVSRQTATAAISDGTSNHWRRTLCATSRTQPIEHPLKWCPMCVHADRERGGRAYWHVEHQYPTTTICRVHQTALHQIPGRHKHWMLPPPTAFQAISVDSMTLGAATVLERIGSAIPGINAINLSALRAETLRRLRDAGVIFSTNGVSHDRIERWFTQTRTAAWCRVTSNGLERFSDGQWIPAMLWRRQLSNAIRWVVLWSALDWESPDTAAESFSDACIGIGHDVGGQLTLFGSALETQTRAPPQVWEAFSECDSYGVVMTKLNCSRGDVVRWLEIDPELRTHWRQRLRGEKQVLNIATIRATLSANPTLNRRSLEELHPAEVRWLREHAARELNDLLKAVPARGGEQAQLFEG